MGAERCSKSGGGDRGFGDVRLWAGLQFLVSAAGGSERGGGADHADSGDSDANSVDAAGRAPWEDLLLRPGRRCATHGAVLSPLQLLLSDATSVARA